MNNYTNKLVKLFIASVLLTSANAFAESNQTSTQLNDEVNKSISFDTKSQYKLTPWQSIKYKSFESLISKSSQSNHKVAQGVHVKTSRLLTPWQKIIFRNNTYNGHLLVSNN